MSDGPTNEWRLREEAVPVASPMEAPTAVAERPVGAPEPPLPPDDPRRVLSRELWPWLLVLALVVLAGLAAFWWFRVHDRTASSTQTTTASVRPAAVRPSKRAPAASVKVPTLVGRTRTQATAELQRLHLGRRTLPVRSDKRAGLVVAQDPRAGSTVKRGAVVALEVSRSTPVRVIPDVRGQAIAPATAALRRAGFEPAIRGVSSPRPRGTVLRETPSPRTTSRRGAVVHLQVSVGPPARASVRTTGTTVTSPATTSRPTTPATSKRAKPAPVSPSPKPAASSVSVPNVVGSDQTAALRALESAGLRTSVTLVASPQPAGQVLRQQPVANGEVGRGTTVELQVALGPNPAAATDVPDVTTQDSTAAEDALRQAGFEVETVDRKVADAGLDGTVVDELPSGQAPQGWTITLVVARAA